MTLPETDNYAEASVAAIREQHPEAVRVALGSTFEMDWLTEGESVCACPPYGWAICRDGR